MSISSRHNKPVVITMGDGAGVGPELCLQALKKYPNVQIYGNRHVLENCANIMQFTLSDQERARIIQINDGLNNIKLPPIGQVSAAYGAASIAYCEAAIADCKSHKIAALVTAPIHKAAVHAANIPFIGHTELLEARCADDSAFMLLDGAGIRVALATCHIPLQSISSELANINLERCVKLTAQACEKLDDRKPKLALLGINPHAGEDGLLGTEEQDILLPLVMHLRSKGIDISDPLPPDTAFLPKYREVFDAYICAYHDQGLIPFKMLAFDTGVNTTLGLSIVRTSVDHGTAFDIVHTGKAAPNSLYAAIDMAYKLST